MLLLEIAPLPGIFPFKNYGVYSCMFSYVSVGVDLLVETLITQSVFSSAGICLCLQAALSHRTFIASHEAEYVMPQLCSRSYVTWCIEAIKGSARKVEEGIPLSLAWVTAALSVVIWSHTEALALISLASNLTLPCAPLICPVVQLVRWFCCNIFSLFLFQVLLSTQWHLQSTDSCLITWINHCINCMIWYQK